MSKYATIKTSFKDGEVLIASLEAMGLQGIQNHIGRPVQLEGYEARLRKESADIVIPRKYVGAASNDLGFKRGTDGTYTAIVSDFDSTKYGPKWMQSLTLEYNQADVAKKMKTAGFKLVNTGTTKNGNIKAQYQQI
jgi:hypothetical protein